MFTLRVQDASDDITGVNMKLVLQSGKLLLRDIGEFRSSCFHLVLIQCGGRRNFPRCENQRQHVNEDKATAKMVGDLDRLVECHLRILIEVDGTKDHLEGESHSINYSIKKVGPWQVPLFRSNLIQTSSWQRDWR